MENKILYALIVDGVVVQLSFAHKELEEIADWLNNNIKNDFHPMNAVVRVFNESDRSILPVNYYKAHRQ